MKKVKDIFTPDTTTVSENSTLKEAASLLRRHNLSGLPVVDDQGQLVGFISESDLIHSFFPCYFDNPDDFMPRKFANLSHKISGIGKKLVKDFMTRKLIYLTEEQTLAEAAEIILRHRLKIVPVLREGKLVGRLGRSRLCDVLMEGIE